MRHLLLLLLFTLPVLHRLQAQDFVTRGKVEYEIKRNNKRFFSSPTSGDNPFLNSLPDYDVSYRDLIFSNNQLIYLPGRKQASPSLFSNSSENSVFTDLDRQKLVVRKTFGEDYYVFEDSVPKVRWKIENETRKIAGWECRKAVGRIFDSVYVVAFYCPEIVPQGGPELFSGLPGLILGLAIPRYYTTWFATKIELANIDESKIAPPAAKKGKQYTRRELAELLFKKYKAAGITKDSSSDKLYKNLRTYVLN